MTKGIGLNNMLRDPPADHKSWLSVVVGYDGDRLVCRSTICVRLLYICIHLHSWNIFLFLSKVLQTMCSYKRKIKILDNKYLVWKWFFN